ncbi:hypothetical protein [Methylopila sp. M107]|uniref:hypothetical protein n=1 Tax=Methylopila sp. M107 TaxID=1101190 RepID=UPI000374C352|nr:hypothetical protein [Methylopila sp. M107]
MTNASPKSSQRRALPQARPSDARYEIAFPKRPPAVSVIAGIFGALKQAFGKSGEAVGDAYAASARVVLDRKEALEDLAAERRHAGRVPAAQVIESATRSGS